MLPPVPPAALPLQPGRVLVVLGSRQSGKTRLLWDRIREVGPGPGVAPQDGPSSLVPWKTLEANLRLPGEPGPPDPARLAALLALLPLKAPPMDCPAWKADPRDRQYTALLRALLGACGNLFLDEPFELLGPAEAEAAYRPLAEWIRGEGLGCLWTTIRPEEALLAADHIALTGPQGIVSLAENRARELAPDSSPFWEERRRLLDQVRSAGSRRAGNGVLQEPVGDGDPSAPSPSAPEGDGDAPVPGGPSR